MKDTRVATSSTIEVPHHHSPQKNDFAVHDFVKKSRESRVEGLILTPSAHRDIAIGSTPIETVVLLTFVKKDACPRWLAAVTASVYEADMSYLDPKNPYTFKKVSGQHPHLLKNFLNPLLPLEPAAQIEELLSLPNHLVPKVPEAHKTSLMRAV